MAKRYPLSSIDTAWLRMERPTNPMMVCVVMAFAEKISFKSLQTVIATRFLRFPRFRERVLMQNEAAYWEPDPNFDLRLHVKRVTLPQPAGVEQLQDLVSDLASTPLDMRRPMWQFHLVEDYGAGSALVARIHHCYADGIALVRVLLSMVDSAPEGAEAQAPAMAAPEADAHGWLAPVSELVQDAAHLGSSLLGTYVDLLIHPTHALDYVRRGADYATEAARLALMTDDTRTRFKGKPRGAKQAAWSQRLQLDEVKVIAKALECSVNDVLMDSAAGALRAYLLERGDKLEATQLRVLVPVNLRPAGEGEELGNYFGLVALLLPLSIENPIERLYEIRARMQALKDSTQATVTLGLLAAVGMGPKALQEQVLDMLANRASAVLTNVPGPQQPLYLQGARLQEIVFWVPQSGDIGMGISIMSYDGGVQFGVITDRAIIADPDQITCRFAEQFEQLLLVTLMTPWDELPTPQSARQCLSE